MKISEIEDKIVSGNLSAAEVFTQMKQHIDAASKKSWNQAIDAAAELMDCGGGVEPEYMRQQLRTR
ncbi:hypothetical protein LCGC14_1362410 [marine sediment metagenome]|uniref:Uncharacterized protein n=1 Tax=marine sediment metagenome TaxID=412755 RepID=A0A0F9K7R8_9ZZZZ